MATPAGTVELAFASADELDRVTDPLVHDLSAMTVIGRTLFCASDETATVERLILNGSGFGEHRNVALGDYFELPDGRDGEMDIEGLAVADGSLWITGSHGLKRKKLKDNAKGFHALDSVKWDPNRSFLGRVPLVDRGDGVYDVAAPGDVPDKAATRPACLAMDKQGRTALRKALGGDPILKRYMDVPCKENGFDVEGLAVLGSHVFLGLRGPVVGGRAVIVETHMKVAMSGVLKPDKIDGGNHYRLHAVDLGGLGIRDLAIDRGRLLILAGPTLDHDGQQAVYALDLLPGMDDPDEIWTPDHLFDLPHTPGHDRAEGMGRVQMNGTSRLMIVYDAPAPHRVDDAHQRITADLFELAA